MSNAVQQTEVYGQICPIASITVSGIYPGNKNLLIFWFGFFLFCFFFQIMKRNLNNVKRMTSHPIYQYCKLPLVPFALSVCVCVNVDMYVDIH